MATVNLGRVGFVPKGEYDSTATYTKLDVVVYRGTAYCALKTLTNVVPTDDGVSWRKLVNGVLLDDTLTDAYKAAPANKVGELTFKPTDYEKYYTGYHLTGLPIFKLTGDMTGMTKTNPVTMSWALNDASGTASVKWQGSSSAVYEKKNFALTLSSNADFGWGNHATYVLKADYIDHSHALNVVSALLWGDIVHNRNTYPHATAAPNYGAMAGVPVILTVNGAFHGLYSLNTPKDAWTYGVASTSTTDYIVEAKTHSEATSFWALAKLDGTDYDVVYKNDSVSVDTVKTSLNTMLQAIMNASGANWETSVAPYFDIDSAIDYLIFSALISNVDGVTKNFVLSTADGVKWRVNAYDLDTVFGNEWTGCTYSAPSQYDGDVIGQSNGLFWLIWKNSRAKLLARYKVLREGIMSPSSVLNKFYNYTAPIGGEVVEQDAVKWRGKMPATYTGTLARIADWYAERVKIVDKNWGYVDSTIGSLQTSVSGLNSDIAELQNTGETTVASGKVWTTTSDGAGWADPTGGGVPYIIYPKTAEDTVASGYVDIVFGLTIETGSITYGEDVSNTKCKRTQGYYEVPSDLTSIHVVCPDDTQCSIFFYDSTHTYKAGTGTLTASNTPIDVPMNSSKPYLRITWRYTSASGKYPDDDLIQTVKLQKWVEGHGGEVDRKNDILAMLNTYGTCVLSKGKYYTSTITMPQGTSIRGCGKESELYLLSTVTDGACIKVSGNNAISDIAFFQQDGNTSRPTANTIGTCDGVRIENEASLTRITNCDFYGFSRSGIYGNAIGHSSCYSALINNCLCMYNAIGIYMYNQMEYASVSNTVCNSNYYGVYNNSGNNLFSACHFDKNYIAWYVNEIGLPLSANGGHGSAVGCSFNHCELYGVYWRGGSNGFAFSGCQFWYSPIYLRSTAWICFTGCQLGGATIPITFNGVSKGHRFSSCSFGTAPTFDTSSASTTTVICIVKDCWLWDGSQEITFA